MASNVTPAANNNGNIMDLERELSCSICTDILYQPLTCIPCLHTFCGSCLKEWFGWQVVRHDQQRARDGSRRSRPEFSCPSCRAAVRETRPNATVTTLVDMYTSANPGKGKSAQERDEINRNYKHGEPVLTAETIPEVSTAPEDPDVVEDRRLLEEVRELSLRDANDPSGGRSPRDAPSRARAHHERRDRRGGQSRRRDASAPHDHAVQQPLGVPSPGRPRSSSRRRRQGERQIEHQSSLRSLLSNSEVESEEMQMEIFRQIAEEGLLDGIDLDNIRVEQEDEISERIAQAYRRRQREMAMQREAHRRGHRREVSTEQATTYRPRSSQQQAPSGSGLSIEAETVSGPRSGTDDQGPRRSERDDTQRRLRTRSQEPPRQPGELRRGTDPARRNFSEQWRQGAAGISPQPPALAILSDDTRAGSAENVALKRSRQPAPKVSSPAPEIPTVTCDSCGAQHIEFELHYNCSRCSSSPTSTFDLCRTCYLLGKGCRHWFGFGYAAAIKFEKQTPLGGWPAETDSPHVLQPRRYVKRPNGSELSSGLTVSLQSGKFCDNCLQNANGCYWLCENCNEGEWGFCNLCISQARHCTHPLLALATAQEREEPSRPLVVLQLSTFCNLCSQSIDVSQSRYHCPTCNDGDFDACNDCYSSLVATERISAQAGPRGLRLCPSGHRMFVVAFQTDDMGYSRRIIREPVVGGWAARSDGASDTTASVHGSRMGQTWSWDERGDSGSIHRRTISASDRTAKQLSNGGWGGKMIALWTRTPTEGAKDELMFPKHAEITEVIDVNGDWCSGVYCRRLGLFPAPFAQLVDR